MDPWFGIAAFLAGMVLLIAIRAPHERVSRAIPIADNRKDAREGALLAGMAVGFFLLPIAGLTPLLAFADYALHPAAFGAGVAAMAASLWLFRASHRDLGTSWSVTLQLRRDHALVQHGVYGRIRHPMYSAIFLYAIAQALLLPNWLAGPACLVAFTVMFALRLHREERMMRDRFGAAYDAYRARTWRLVPWVW